MSKVRDEFIIAVQDLMLEEISHCHIRQVHMEYCTEDEPCPECKERRRILDMIDNPKNEI